MNEYLSTYYTLVELQCRYDKDSFYLYNKSLFVVLIQSNKSDAAYLFYVTNESNSKLQILETNKSLSDVLYQGILNIKGTFLLWNITLNNVHYHLIIQRDLEHTDPNCAMSLAYETFLGEYRDMLVEQARKKAEKNNEYAIYYYKLRDLKKLMDDRTRDGTYLNNLTVFKSDQSLFNELVQKCGLNDSEAIFYKNMQIPRKELLGTGLEYDNNWLYSIIFLIIFSFAFILRYLINENIKDDDQNSLISGIGTFIKEITYAGLLAVYWTNKPYDFTIYQFLFPLVAFALFYFISIKFFLPKREV